MSPLVFVIVALLATACNGQNVEELAENNSTETNVPNESNVPKESSVPNVPIVLNAPNVPEVNLQHIPEPSYPQIPQIHENLPPMHENLPPIHENLPPIHENLPPIHIFAPAIVVPRAPTTTPQSFFDKIRTTYFNKKLCPNPLSIQQPPCQPCTMDNECGEGGTCCYRLWLFPFRRCCA